MMQTQSIWQYAARPYLVEVERIGRETLCTIARADGTAITFRGDLARMALDTIAKHGAERMAASYIKAAPYASESRGEWVPTYKPAHVRNAIGAGVAGRQV